MPCPKHVSRQTGLAPTAAMAAILENTAAHGGSVDELLAECGIGGPGQAGFDEALRHLRRDQLASLGKRCVQYLMKRGEEHGGLPPMEPSDYNMLCCCIINCHTLGEAIERAGDFCRMLRGRGGELSLQIAGADAALFVRRFYTSDIWEDFFVDFFALFCWHKLFSWMIGDNITLNRVSVKYRKFLDYSVTSMFFPSEVRWSQPDTTLSFPARFLEARIVQNYDGLVELLKLFPNDFTSPSFGARKLSDDVRLVYVDSLAKGAPPPTIEKMARRFGLSEATLRRRLNEEGVSAEVVKDECRRERACDYLRETALTIEDIAGRLGFSCAKTFRDAFIRWTGQSPSSFRKMA
jgi:AraC-like DNA-binding protein